MPDMHVSAAYQPTGDQPRAIAELAESVNRGDRYQTLLGATGTGKTHTVARVIEQVQKPTLVVAHNKTLAAQLCNEFREYFPHNAVEYFVSLLRLLPARGVPARRRDTYIEKDSSINDDIDRLRHAATAALSHAAMSSSSRRCRASTASARPTTYSTHGAVPRPATSARARRSCASWSTSSTSETMSCWAAAGSARAAT